MIYPTVEQMVRDIWDALNQPFKSAPWGLKTSPTHTPASKPAKPAKQASPEKTASPAKKRARSSAKRR